MPVSMSVPARIDDAVEWIAPKSVITKPVEAEPLTQDRREGVVALARVDAVDLVERAHHRPEVGFLDRVLVRIGPDLHERAVADDRVLAGAAVHLLLVAEVVLEVGDDVLLLHLLHERRRHLGDEERVLARVLPGPSPVRLADRVGCRGRAASDAPVARASSATVWPYVRATSGSQVAPSAIPAGSAVAAVIRALGLPTARRDARARVRHPQLGDAQPLDRPVVEGGRRLALIAGHQLDLLLERHRAEHERGTLIRRQARIRPRPVRFLSARHSDGHGKREGGHRGGERQAPAERSDRKPGPASLRRSLRPDGSGEHGTSPG